MTSRDRFLATMNYGPRDRAPLREFGAWPETIQRWIGEGYDPESTDFGCDPWAIIGHWFFPAPPFEHTVIEEDDTYITYVDSQGIVMREFKNNPYSSMPQFIRFPVETREDFRAFWRERMVPDPALHIGPNWREELRQHRGRDYPFVVIADRWGGMFGPLRNLLGVENLCMLFYDDPALLEEMMDADADFTIAMLGQILEETDIDVFGLWEDMGYNTGPLISADMVRKYMLPRYKKVIEFARSRGVPHISLDSDGQIDSLIPVWLDAGVDILYPFENAAGMDVVAVRKKYGRDLRMWGGIDKRAVARGKEAIDVELARIAPVVADGGYVPYLDHTAPPDISFANYTYFMEQLEKIL